MIRALALWLIQWLEKHLDPDLQVRIDKLNQKVSDREAQERLLQERIEASQKESERLTVVLASDLARRRELEDAIARSKEEAEKKLVELDSLSSRDRVRVDL